jgi:hypothetical protein
MIDQYQWLHENIDIITGRIYNILPVFVMKQQPGLKNS